MQCQGDLCNVGTVFAATGYFKKTNQFKIKIAKKWCYSDDIALGFFLWNFVWSFLSNIAQGFCLCNVVSRILWHYWTEFFMCNVVWSLMDNIAQGFYLWNVVLRWHWTWFFLSNVVWSILDNMAQVFFQLLVQCCPKKIKTTLKKIFLVHCCLQPQGQHYIGFFL